MQTVFHFFGYLRGSSEIWMVLRGVVNADVCGVVNDDVCGVGERLSECIVYYMYNRGIVKEIPTTGII